jgi:hypothetical protein
MAGQWPPSATIGRGACSYCEDARSWPAGRFGYGVCKATYSCFNALPFLDGWAAGFKRTDVPSVIHAGCPSSSSAAAATLSAVGPYQ